jgi:valyl-tRNA synthetase
MDTKYEPQGPEQRWYSFWMGKALFRPTERDGRPYVIVMPPPNITGQLTVGHSLNLALQDALIRWRMLKGEECLWLPGKDHAGIATQTAVEKQLAEDGLTRHDLGRDRFVESVWKWKDRMDRKINDQIRQLGCACDWSRERFTMDEGLSAAVRTAFVRLFKEGLIYRGEYVINSCPRCLTTLSEEEVEREDIAGKLYYIRYPFEGGGHLTVATTRPETMLGDVAVAVNPDDQKYRDALEKTVILPLVKRRIPMIRDEFVDPEFGTGAVKVTPAHDADDFLIGRRHDLSAVTVMDQKGTMNENAGEFAGLDRFEARKRIVERLKKEKLLEKVTDYVYSMGRCYRCSTPVEPYLSTQYFVRMKPLAEPAIRAVKDGRIKLHPERWTKVYFNWMEGIRDWCISRQLWWGHRIPVWHCSNCEAMISEMDDPAECPHCSGPIVREEDVLDTWFSSWLWPFSTLGWPGQTEDLKRYYPTSALVTAPDIIFFWVARMIMAGLYFMKDIPFEDVYLHGLIRDEFGQKMSKSLGNSPDPVDIIARYGADALRFTLISSTPKGSDILFAERHVETGRNFANKVWNAARLVNSVSQGIEVDPGSQGSEICDRWITSRAAHAMSQVDAHFGRFELNEAAKAVYDFIWHEFCDWYLEIAKDRFYSTDEGQRNQAVFLARAILRLCLDLLHPFMPFLTEEIRSVLVSDGRSILEQGRVQFGQLVRDREAERVMEAIMGIVEVIRNIRGEMGVHPSAEVPLYLDFSSNGELRSAVWGGKPYIMKMGRVGAISEGSVPRAEGPIATGIVQGIEVRVPLGNVIDLEIEKKRLSKEIRRIDRVMEKARVRVESPGFTEKAPPEVVAREKDKIEKLREARAKLEKNLGLLAG